MAPQEILRLYEYFFKEAGEGQHLHDPTSAGASMVRLWQDIVRPHCEDVAITVAINSLIEEAYSTALADFEEQILRDNRRY